MYIDPKPIKGTTRRRVITNPGTELSRQYIYMKEEVWEALTELASKQGTSGSIVIAQLVKLASRLQNQASK